MGKLFSSVEVAELLRVHGFIFISQRGSHVKYRDGFGRTVIIPAGRRELPRGTMASIIRQSGLPRELFN